MIGDVYKTCFWKSVHKGRPPGVISVEAPPGSHLRQLPQRSRELISLKWVPWPDRKVIWIGPLWHSRLTRWWVGQPILWRLGSDKMSLSFDFRINHQVSQRRLKLSGRLNILKKKNITKPFKIWEREIWNLNITLNMPTAESSQNQQDLNMGWLSYSGLWLWLANIQKPYSINVTESTEFEYY